MRSVFLVILFLIIALPSSAKQYTKTKEVTIVEASNLEDLLQKRAIVAQTLKEEQAVCNRKLDVLDEKLRAIDILIDPLGSPEIVEDTSSVLEPVEEQEDIEVVEIEPYVSTTME